MRVPRYAGLGPALLVLILSSLSAEVVRSQATASVAGSVNVVSRPARRLATAGVYPGRSVSPPVERETSELDNVVVFVRHDKAVPASPMRTTINQTHQEFVPHVVAVTIGSTVEFPNGDPVFHNVFSLSRAATFDLGRYPRHTSKSRTFKKPGVVKVFCHFHSHMSAIVHVFDHPHFAMPDRDGRFAIRDLPVGKYEVTAWHERAGEVTQPVTVSVGDTPNLRFSLPLKSSE